jgi:RNA polymerase sigma factor (sigma-70 family)
LTEGWATEFLRGRTDHAWDLFLTRYRRLIFAAIRHYTQDYDDVMDVFARVCEALRADDFRRLRTYVEGRDHRARFSTWLVTVVRHLTVDWFRERDGRKRLPALAAGLPDVQRRIFEHVFLGRRSHLETYELIRAGDSCLSFRQFLVELRATYRAVTQGRRGTLLRDLGGPFLPDAEAPEPSPSDVADLRELAERLLSSLTAEERVAVQLYVIHELPAEDVARIIGAPNAKVVYNRVYRALAAARGTLERAGIRREDVL